MLVELEELDGDNVVHVVSSRCTILYLESPRVSYAPWNSGPRTMEIGGAHGRQAVHAPRILMCTAKWQDLAGYRSREKCIKCIGR